VNADLNTWLTTHNDGKIVFVFECVILSRKWTPNVTKWQITNPNNKSNDKIL